MVLHPSGVLGPSPSARSLLLPLAVCLGISAGFADLAIGMFAGRSGFDSLAVTVPSVLATAVSFAMVYLVLGALSAPLLRKVMGIEAPAALLAAGVFLLGAVTLLSIRDLLTPLLNLPADGRRAELILFLLFALLVAAGALYAFEHAPSSRPLAIRLLSSAPLLLSETVVAWWIWQEAFANPLTLVQKIGFAAGFVAIVAASFAVSGRILSRFPSSFGVASIAGAALLLPLLAALPAFSSHRDDEQVGERPRAVRRVILIVVDTLRADALSSNGRGDPQTRHIDELARESFVFKNAYSSASWTLPSMSSLLTGLFPSVHLATKPASRLPRKLPTLASYLRDAGYLTGAIGDNTLLGGRSNLGQGFEEYDFYPKRTTRDFGSNLLARYSGIFGRRFALRPSTEDLTDLAEEWIERHGDRDFFLWLHYLDPHLPYAPPERFLDDAGVWGLEHFQSVRVGTKKVSREERKQVRELYQAEVRYVDEQVGRLIAFLKEKNLFEDSLVVLTSDHGEEFWDHGGLEHGHATWNEILHVPLIVKMPGGASIGAHEGAVPTIGIMPTILDLSGVSYDASTLSVSPLTPLLRGDVDSYEAAPLYASSTLYFEDLETILFDGMKYTRSQFTGKETLYDLSEDPEERLSLVSQEDLEKMRVLHSQLQADAANLRARHGLTSGEQRGLTPAEIEQLKSLGYVQ